MFNGAEVRSLAHLVRLVEECTQEEEPWMKFEFDGVKEIIVLKTSEVAAATREVCEQNMIPAPRYLEAREDGGGVGAKAGVEG
jgi:hypothetical protein